MSEKLCLQWNDFKDNAINAFGSLRDDNDFTDVTLACEDGKQVEVHKVDEEMHEAVKQAAPTCSPAAAFGATSTSPELQWGTDHIEGGRGERDEDVGVAVAGRGGEAVLAAEPVALAAQPQDGGQADRLDWL